MFSLCGNLVSLLLVVISLACCTLAVPLSDFYPVDGGALVRGDDGFSYPQRPISSSKKIPFFGTLYDFIVVSWVCITRFNDGSVHGLSSHDGIKYGPFVMEPWLHDGDVVPS